MSNNHQNLAEVSSLSLIQRLEENFCTLLFGRVFLFTHPVKDTILNRTISDNE